MPTATRTFRVFVSSTFEDLRQERDVLQREAFPKLRLACQQHSARFQAIDLRWGVRDEAALDQKTMEVCLREIERCQRTGIKPNFIVLLGQRYGWRPLPSRIPAEEFQAVLGGVPAREDRALMDGWYLRDDNAVPPEYVLRPRTAEWAEPGRWQELEPRLHCILLEAARVAGLPEQAMVKFGASATHQEILKGLGATPEDRRHVFVFCRQLADQACEADLASLKRFLRAQLPAENIIIYDPSNLAGFCLAVERTLRAVIESEAAGFESRPALALEVDAHDAFARERALVFGRDDVLGAISDYVAAGGDRPLVLLGASGSGKSAVMAQASERASKAVPSAVVLRRFIGASPESSSGLTLLRSLSEQIGGAYGVHGELPADLSGVTRVFRERLALATSARPLVVFIDALDQLRKDDPASPLIWIGGTLPAHCRVVASTTDHVPALNDCRLLRLNALPAADAATALDHWLTAAHRQLQPAQRDRLLGAFSGCGLPLYLKLAFEEARGWPSSLPCAECQLGDGVEGLIDTLLLRLSLESNHGRLMIGRSLGYMAAARYGLTEDEMLDVLSSDSEVWGDFERRAHHTPPDRRLPVIIWSRLFLDLEPYLAERVAPGGTVVSFYHRQLAERAVARFLAGEERKERHTSLAGYFAAQPLWADAEAKQHPNRRKLSELPYQQAHGGYPDELMATLSDFSFIHAKIVADTPESLLQDYDLAITAGRLGSVRENTLRLVQGAIRLAALVVGTDISQLASRLTGGLLGWDQPEITTLLDAIRRAQRDPWLRPLNPALARAGKALLLTVEGHRGGVWAVAVTPDGRRVVSGSEDSSLRVWKFETGEPLHTLAGHTGSVRAVAVTPDGRRVVSGADDNTLRVWDLETGQTLRTLEGHTGGVCAVAVTSDGRRLISGSWDKTVRLWDLGTGTCEATLTGHMEGVTSVAVTPDGRLAISGSWDKTVRLWDLGTRACEHTLTGHMEVVTSVAVTPNGRRIVSGSWDKTLRVWDLEAVTCERTLSGRTSYVWAIAITPDGRRVVDDSLWIWDLETGTCERELAGEKEGAISVAVTPDGRHAVSGSPDCTLRVWDLECGNELHTSEGHKQAVLAVTVTPDGRHAVSGSMDSTLRLWDIETGQGLRTLRGHTGHVQAVAVTPDGRRAVSGGGFGDNTLRSWNLETGETLHSSEQYAGYFQTVAVTPDGRRAVAGLGAFEHTLEIWDLETGKTLHSLQGHSGSINAVAITHDGRCAISGSDDRTLRVWDLKTGKILSTIEGHLGPVKTVVMTPDGRRAVSGSGDGTLRVWDLETGQTLRILPVALHMTPHRAANHTGHKLAVMACAVTRDGRRAVSASQDGTLCVWDLEAGKPITRFVADHPLECCAVTPDGLTLLAGDEAGNVHFLRLENAPNADLARTTDARVARGSVPGPVVGLNDHAYLEQLHRAVLAIDEESLGRDHPDLAKVLAALADILQEEGRLVEAEQFARRRLEILLRFTRATGHHHPSLQESFGDYGALLKAMGYNVDEVMRRLFEIGESHGIKFG